MSQTLIISLAVTTAIQAVGSMATLSVAVIAPTVAQHLDLPLYFVGMQVSLVYLCAVLMLPASAGIARRAGPARASQIALLCTAGGIALCAAGTIPSIALGSPLLGIGYALTGPAASEILIRVAPENSRNLVFSLKQTGVPIGGTLAGLFLPSIAVLYDWRLGFGLVAVAAVCLVAPLQLLRPSWDAQRDLAPQPGRKGMSMGASWPPAIRAIGLIALLYSAIQLAVGTFLVSMLVGEFRWSEVAAGFALAAVQGSGVLGRVFWGLLADRVQAGLVVLGAIGAGTAAMAFLVALVPQHASAIIVGTVVSVLGFCSLGWNGVMLAEAARVSPPGQIGSMTSAVLICAFSGVVIGPSIFSLVAGVTGSFAVSYGLFGILALTGGAFALTMARRTPA